ncbi:type VII secretion system-associated protein [Streptomyces sp. NPDC051636]|uniref:type VII secretion system-associated protein n=1 Tax=Streptomyces sp. NPDC051636 TaxID=3365663 RepID=UPI00379FFD5A
MANKTVLSTEWLKQFIDVDFDDFRTVLRKMLHDDPSGRSLEFIADGDITVTTLVAQKPLGLGYMASTPASTGGGQGDTSDAKSDKKPVIYTGGTKIPQVGGDKLNKSIQNSASEIYQLFRNHDKLFEDVEHALRETIQKMKETQAKSLDKISIDTFMDIFEDVDSDLTSANNAGTGGSGTGDDGGNGSDSHAES